MKEVAVHRTIGATGRRIRHSAFTAASDVISRTWKTVCSVQCVQCAVCSVQCAVFNVQRVFITGVDTTQVRGKCIFHGTPMGVTLHFHRDDIHFSQIQSRFIVLVIVSV